MKKIMLSLFCLGGLGLFAADTLIASPDRTGLYLCHCNTSLCPYGDFSIHYERKTQFFKAEGPKWLFSGYFARQESKSTGEVYLITPENYTMGKFTFVVAPSGEVRSNEADVICKQ